MKISIGKVLSFAIVLFTILSSKTVYFGIIYRDNIVVLLCVLCVITFFLNKGLVQKKAFITMFMLWLTLIGVTAFHSNEVDYSYLDNIFLMLIVFCQMAIIVSCVPQKEYIKYYVNIIVGISIISLVCIFIASYCPSISSRLLTARSYGDHVYLISPYYTWGLKTTGILPRNSGMFWEPGAFQGFIILAVLMILFHKDDIKNRRIKIIVLILTLLTTKSTTGYVIFLMVCVIFWHDITNVFNNVKKQTRNKSLKRLFIGLLAIVGMYICIVSIINSGNIEDKLYSKNSSQIIRSSDISNSIKMILEKPVLGFGQSVKRNLRESSLGIKSNSVGLFIMMYTYGLIFSLLYIYKYKKGLDSMFPTNNIVKKVTLYIIFVVLYMTEGLFWLPVYVVFLFEWPYVDNNKNKQNDFLY